METQFNLRSWKAEFTIVENLHQPGVSVIICAYTEERWNDLVEAVESVQRQTLQPREIIVVIDHSAGLFHGVRDRFVGKGVQVVENAGDPGLSGARNTGIAVATMPFVVFLDDDAVARPDWLERLITPYENSRILGVGGMLKPWWLRGKPAWFPEEFNWVVGCSYRGMPESARPIRNPFGGNMSFRKEVFEDVGLFRSGIGRIGTLPVGCEETEMCIRAGQRWPDRLFLYEPEAEVSHRVPPQRTTWSYFLARCWAEGLSKALVAQIAGRRDSLASEWTYTLRILPQGVARGLADALFRGDVVGLARAAAIISGLLLTTTGYFTGYFKGRAASRLSSWNQGDT